MSYAEMTAASQRTPYKFSSKSNARKEILEWAAVEMNAADAMRGAGQLTENVTEARMLKGNMMELSRERYKFKTQAEFDKKFFLEGQMRKTKTMPELLRSVDTQQWTSEKNKMQQQRLTGARPSSRPEAETAEDKKAAAVADLAAFNFVSEEDSALSGGALFGKMPVCHRNNKTGPVASLDPVASHGTIARREAAGSPGKNALLYENGKEKEAEGELYEGQDFFATQVPRSVSQKVVQFPASPVETPPSAEKSFLPKIKPHRCSSTQGFIQPVAGPRRSSSGAVHPRRRTRSSIAALTPVAVSQDERFVNLHMTLSANRESGNADDILDVISRIDALSSNTKSSQYAKPKLNTKIIEYMRSRGIFVN